MVDPHLGAAALDTRAEKGQGEEQSRDGDVPR